MYQRTKCSGLPCDGLASHPGESRNTPNHFMLLGKLCLCCVTLFSHKSIISFFLLDWLIMWWMEWFTFLDNLASLTNLITVTKNRTLLIYYGYNYQYDKLDKTVIMGTCISHTICNLCFSLQLALLSFLGFSFNWLSKLFHYVCFASVISRFLNLHFWILHRCTVQSDYEKIPFVEMILFYINK